MSNLNIRPSRRRIASYALAACCLLLPEIATAQAWLPDKGVLSGSFLVSDAFTKEHYLPNGDEIDVGHTRSTTYAMYASYGLTDRVMIAASLPYIETRYWGPPSHGGAPGFEADDGDTHGSLTDLRLSVHYQLLEDPLALAPFISYVTPVTDYFVTGHAAQGRHLQELLLGFNAGKNLDEWIPANLCAGAVHLRFRRGGRRRQTRSHQRQPRNRHVPYNALEYERLRLLAVDARRHRRANPTERPIVSVP